MKRPLWRVAVALILVVSLVTAGTTAVLAQTSPHEGTFTTTTDACAGCHRAHTGVAAEILKSSSQYNLCTSCHNGTSANTKVTTGVYLGTGQGTQGAGLRGGGFEQALMDTDVNGSTSSSNITSKHTVGGSSMTAWGSGTSSNGESVSLECGDCHNPHGNSEYRILRPKPTSLGGWSNLGSENITAGVSDNYTINYDGSNYRKMSDYTTAVLDNMGDWCGQCHTRYPAGAGSETSTAAGGDSGSDNWTAGTSPFEYRHRTEPLSGECLSCHVAHGTNASMSAYAAGPTWPDSSSSQTWQSGNEGEYSRLLHVDDRGVCMQCHTSGDLATN